jgi:putative Mn2+ efflux pump MntP
MRLDPGSAALYALIAICLVLIGALITPGTVGLNERGAVLGGIVVVLFTVARLFHRRHNGDE